MKAHYGQYLRRVLQYLRPYRKLAAASLCLMLIGSAAALLVPWPLKILVDHVLEKHPMPHYLVAMLGSLAADPVTLLVTVVVGGLGIALLTNGLHVLSNYVNTHRTTDRA